MIKQNTKERFIIELAPEADDRFPQYVSAYPNKGTDGRPYIGINSSLSGYIPVDEAVHLAAWIIQTAIEMDREKKQADTSEGIKIIGEMCGFKQGLNGH
jgi:hypothetical protein